MADKNDYIQSKSLLGEKKYTDGRLQTPISKLKDNEVFLSDNLWASRAFEKDDGLPRSRLESKGRVVASATGMYVGYMAMGMAHAVVGTTLLELQIQCGAGIEQLSLLFTWAFIGRVISSFLSSAIFDRFHPEVQLGLSLFICFIATASVPFLSMYAFIAVALAIQGMCAGYMSTACCAYCFHLWGAKTGPFLMALHFTFSVGCTLTPIIAEPFLTQTSGSTLDTTNVTSLMYQSTAAPLASNLTIPIDRTSMASIEYNGTQEGLFLDSVIKNMQHTVLNGTGMLDINTENPAEINTTLADDAHKVFGKFHRGTFYPYIIVAVCQALPALYFIIQFAIDGCQILQSFKDVKSKQSKTSIPVMFIFMVVLFCSCGVEIAFGGLLYTYAVKGLDWSVTRANYLATVFWATFSGSRAIAIPLSKFVAPKILLGVVASVMVVTMSAMAIGSHVYPIVMWVSTAGMGLALSSQIANTFVYAGEFISMTGRNSGFLMATIYIGGSCVPALTGLLFDKVGTVWFPYTLVIFSAILFTMYIVIVVFGKRIAGRTKLETSESSSVNEETTTDGSSGDSHEMTITS